MKKLLALFLLLCVLQQHGRCQSVAIGGNGEQPHANAVLDLKSNNKGFLVPRLTEAQRTALNPAPDAKGLLVYQTDGAQGFYYFDGMAWIPVNGGTGGGSGPWLAAGNNILNKNIGRVGISDGATFWPMARLHIRSNSSTDSTNQLVLEETDNDYARLSWRNAGNAKFWTLAGYSGGTSNGKDWMNVYHSGYGNLLSFSGGGHTLFHDSGFVYQGGQPKLSIPYNSTVGNPHLLLYERDSLDHARLSFMNRGNDNFWTIAAAQQQSDTTTRLNFYHSAKGNLLTIAGTGNVGIGTDLPFQKLDVAGNVNVPIDSSYRIGGVPVVFTRGDDNLMLGKNNVPKLTGRWNTFAGSWTGTNTTAGEYNSFFGMIAGNLNTTGSRNTFAGVAAGHGNTEGSLNTAIGTDAGHENKTGSANTFLGFQAGYWTTGSSNVFIGRDAGLANKSGSNNIAIGDNADVASAALVNATAIGSGAVVSASNAVVLGNNASVGIGVSAPTAKLEVNGFTKLGSDAPAVKTKKLTGTTAASQGAGVSLPLAGIDPSKILSVSVIVKDSGNDLIPSSYGFSQCVEHNWKIAGTNLVVQNVAGNSGCILSKPMTVFITYEQ